VNVNAGSPDFSAKVANNTRKEAKIRVAHCSKAAASQDIAQNVHL